VLHSFQRVGPADGLEAASAPYTRRREPPDVVIQRSAPTVLAAVALLEVLGAELLHLCGTAVCAAATAKRAL
jgi:hypothetical protein